MDSKNYHTVVEMRKRHGNEEGKSDTQEGHGIEDTANGSAKYVCIDIAQ
jgi:hypothetical protein